MRLVEIFRGIVRNLASAVELLRAIVAGIDNGARLVHDKLEAVIAGIDNHSRIVNSNFQNLPTKDGLDKLEAAIIQSISEIRLEQAELTKLLNRQETTIVDGMNNVVRALKEKLDSLDEHLWLTASRSAGIIQGIDNDSRLTNEIAKQIIVGMNNLSQLLNNKLGGATGPEAGESTGISNLEKQPASLQQSAEMSEPPSVSPQPERTSPGEFSGLDRPSHNAALSKLSYFRTEDRIERDEWTRILQNAFEEVSSLPDTGAVLESLGSAQPANAAHRANEAAFLFWLVRRLKPRDIVQVAEPGELSTLLMLLALTKNAATGQLHLLGPSAAEPKKDQQERWAFPELYRSKLRMYPGDPNILIPQIARQLETIDVFYASGGTQESIMWQLDQIRDDLSAGGITVAKGPAGTVAIRDFASKHGVSSLDIGESLGVAFF
jgi:hypothetical protein